MKLSNLNPWAANRRLRERIAYLEGRLEEVSERADDAEGRAFDRAARYWQYQVERERQQNEAAAMRHLSAISAMTAPQVLCDGDNFSDPGIEAFLRQTLQRPQN